MKISITILLLIAVITAATADDGSWNKAFSINGGSIYSETEHTEISLEKELLLFNGKKTTVFLLFKNTSASPIVVECGFPVHYDIQAYKIENRLEIPAGKYGPNINPSLGFFETVELAVSEDEPDFMLPEAILINEFNNSREFIDFYENKSGAEFAIFQNGTPVKVKEVLIDRHAGDDGASITYHFKHNLAFEPGESSIVKVDYTQDLLFGDPGMMEGVLMYRWNYVIGTGSSWNGPIGELYMIKPAEWTGELGGLDLVHADSGVELYRAEGYEPEIDTRFALRMMTGDFMERMEYLRNTFPEYKRMWTSAAAAAVQPADPVQDFVTDVSASSALVDRLKVFTPDGVIERAGFGANSAFDGYPETSWCENADGNGVGEYLQVELLEPVWGVEIRNGFKRFTADDWVYKNRSFEREIRDDSAGLKDYFNMNGRIKTFSIHDDTGNLLYTLDLADRRDPQTFAGVFLPEGSYRFIIEDVYEGTRWKDTCLAELSFLPAEKDGELIRFLNDPFYRKALVLTGF